MDCYSTYGKNVPNHQPEHKSTRISQLFHSPAPVPGVPGSDLLMFWVSFNRSPVEPDLAQQGVMEVGGMGFLPMISGWIWWFNIL